MQVELDKLNLFKRGLFRIPAPPVSTYHWSDTDWIKYIDRDGSWEAGKTPLEPAKMNKHGGWDFGHTSCYGHMHEYQNVVVSCDDEDHDYIICRGFDSWALCIEYIRKVEAENKHIDMQVVQLEAV